MKASDCANKLAIIVKMRLNVSLSEAEIAYLTLHVARVTSHATESHENDDTNA